MEDKVVPPHKLPEVKNIKHGNSLVDEVDFDKETAFNWEENFSNIIKDGGFDIVIGNPPYVAWHKIPIRKALERGKFLDLEYAFRPRHPDSQPNMYLFFLALGVKISKRTSCFIIPHEWMWHNYSQDFRNYLLRNCGEIRVYKFKATYKVFRTNDTIGTTSLIIFCDKKANSKSLVLYTIDSDDDNEVKMALEAKTPPRKVCKKSIIPFKKLRDKPWKFTKADELKEKILSGCDVVPLTNKEYFEVVGGFQPPIDRIEQFTIEAKDYNNIPKKERDVLFPVILEAKEMTPFVPSTPKKRWWTITNEHSVESLKRTHPKIYDLLAKRIKIKSASWWKFPNIRNFDIIQKYPIKIFHPRTKSENSFCLDIHGSVFKGTNSIIISKKIDPIYVLGILNSSLADYWYSKLGTIYHGKTRKYEPQKLKAGMLPILLASDKDREEVVKTVKRLISLYSEKHKIDDRALMKGKKLDGSIHTLREKLNKKVLEIYSVDEKDLKK